MRVALELVPRSIESLKEECETVKRDYPVFSAINIPDLLRFPVRSWDAAQAVKSIYDDVIPHIRSIDFDVEQPLKIAALLKSAGVKEVLVVKGDPPQDMSRKTFNTSPLRLIAALKRELPDLKVYAAIDPFRNGIQQEIEYVHQKIDAGADGFFTQPFFDLRMVEIFAEKLKGLDVYWGISPVVTENSKNYWESRNKAVFPQQFSRDYGWNAAFARDMLDFCAEMGFNAYFMPIRIDLKKYFSKVFSS